MKSDPEVIALDVTGRTANVHGTSRRFASKCQLYRPNDMTATMAGLSCLVLCILLFRLGPSASQESIRFPVKGDSAGNVIHVNCGGGQPPAGEEMPRNPGSPGKMGPVGPIGPKGIKGEMADRGIKGDRGVDANVEEVKIDVLGMLSVTSCMELNSKYGLNKTGHYLMRINGTRVSGYRHCHFNLYQDIFTCHELRQSEGVSESGHFILGTRDNPYEVYCEFTPGPAVTQVWHDSMQEVQIAQKCETQGCYSRMPYYEIHQSGISKIIAKSATCRQYIKLRCMGNVLLQGGYGWWVSQHGEKMGYWGGTTKDGYCACGLTGSCVDANLKCNCDNNQDTRTTQDEGFLYDKSKLPVREMRFGDMGGSNEMGWHELGRLECEGQA